MQSTEGQQFRALLAGVFAFYGKDLSEFAIGVWWEAMKPFDLAAVRDALNRHCVNPDNGQFLPKPADVVRLLQGGTQDSALVAWAEAMKAMRELGSYRTVQFADAITNAVIHDMGGWPSLGRCEVEELPFKAREFENRYRGYRLRGEAPEVRPLIGLADMANASKGLQTSEPVLIGQRKAITQKHAELEAQ